MLNFFHFVPTLESTAGTNEGESEAVKIIEGTSIKKVYAARVMDYTQHLKDFSFLQYHKILSLESFFNYLTFDRNNKTIPNSVSIIKFSHLKNSPYHRPALSSVFSLGEKNM